MAFIICFVLGILIMLAIKGKPSVEFRLLELILSGWLVSMVLFGVALVITVPWASEHAYVERELVSITARGDRRYVYVSRDSEHPISTHPGCTTIKVADTDKITAVYKVRYYPDTAFNRFFSMASKVNPEDLSAEELSKDGTKVTITVPYDVFKQQGGE